MDFNTIAQQLLDAVQKASDVSVKSLGQQRQNEFAKINNVNNQRGTLYSTQGGYQRTQFDVKHNAAVSQAQAQPLQTRFSVAGQVQDAQRQIDALNRAAQALNVMDFNY